VGVEMEMLFVGTLTRRLGYAITGSADAVVVPTTVGRRVARRNTPVKSAPFCMRVLDITALPLDRDLNRVCQRVAPSVHA
jgi:hypothetical protein